MNDQVDDLAPASELERLLASMWQDDMIDQVKACIARGSHPDGSRGNGLPLRLAVRKFWTPVVDCLLASGANPNARLESECSPGSSKDDSVNRPVSPAFSVLHLAILEGGQATMNTSGRAEIGATKTRSESALKNILKLIAAGADREATNSFGMNSYGYSREDLRGRRVAQAVSAPLHAAIELDSPELCLQLLSAGISPDDKNARRQSAWRHAELKSPECMSIMTAWKSRQAMQMIAKQARPSRHSEGP